MVLILMFGLSRSSGRSCSRSRSRTCSRRRTGSSGSTTTSALADDPLFRDSVLHTVVYTALFVPLSVAGALLIAVALNRPLRGSSGCTAPRCSCPSSLSTIATAIIFLQLFDPNFGLINWAARPIGLGPFGFLQDPNQALYAIVDPDRVGLDRLRRDRLPGGAAGRAARADRGGDDRRRHGPFGAFRRVVVPLLGPATLFLVVWSTINALQLFDEIYFLTKGGPLFSTYVLVYYVFDLAFQKGLAGYAAASRTPCSRHPGADRDPARDRPADGALLVMSTVDVPRRRKPKSRWPLPFSPVAPGARAGRAGDADAAGVDARRRRSRRWPRRASSRRDHPVGHHTGRTTATCPHRGPVRALVREHDDRHRRVGHRQPRVLQPGRLRVRAAAVRRQEHRVLPDPGDADDPVPGGDDPDVPDHPLGRADRHAGRADPAQPGERRSASS